MSFDFKVYEYWLVSIFIPSVFFNEFFVACKCVSLLIIRTCANCGLGDFKFADSGHTVTVAI